MSETLEQLKNMLRVSGLSGFEEPIRELIRQSWQPLTDEISVSKLGSLHALRHGRGPAPRKRLLVATHMDAIGMIVTHIEDGLLRVTEIGGIDARVLPGQLVTVHAHQDLPGVIAQPPAHTLPKSATSGPVPLENLLIDTGLTAKEVEKQVHIGNLVSFATEPVEMKGSYIAGHSLDNRASVAVMTECLQVLQKRLHQWDVIAVATAQEEETLGGAKTSGFELQPDLAVVIDVTFAKGPGSNETMTYDLNKGPVLEAGPNTHPRIHQAFSKLAQTLDLPHQQGVYPGMSGTDAITLQIAGKGVPIMVMSVPLRYMHTPVEMVQFKDIQRAGRLLAEFITALDEDFEKTLQWQYRKEKEGEQS